MFNRSLTPFGAAFVPKLTQSIICDGGASMTRTFTSTVNDSWAIALRRSKFGATQNVLSTSIQFNSSDQIVAFGRTSTRVFRDVGWYVFLLNPTSMYVASSSGGGMDEVTGSGTYTMASITDPVLFGSASQFEGGCAGFWHADSVAWSVSDFVNSFAFDGQSITIADDPALTYGPDGVRLLFADTSAFGDDTSGNANDWTPTGFVAGDQTADVPGRPYAVLNPLQKNASLALGDGGLFASVGGANNAVAGTLSFDTGQFYWEIQALITADQLFGIVSEEVSHANRVSSPFNKTGSFVFYGFNGNKYQDGVPSSYDSAISVNDVIMIAVDADAGKIWYGKNGVWLQSGNPSAGTGEASTIGAHTWTPIWEGGASNADCQANFGQRAFAYTPPSGFLPLSTDNLPTPLYAGKNWFDANIRTGTGAAYNVTTGPANGTDLAWIKGRSGATDHALYDIVRGVQQQLESNTTTAETTETTGLTAFNLTGYSGGALAQINTNLATYVDWMWGAGGAGVANTGGTISSTVSVAAAGHFSIVGYTGTGANATVGHGFPGAPECIIIKNRDQADAWAVYHSGVAADAETDYLVLNTTAAAVDDATYWQDTAPTSSVFSIGTAVVVNTNTEDYIAYCFRSIPGLCKVGSYTGNGAADGPLIWLGFTPRWIMLKRVDSTGDWWIYDTVRGTINPIDEKLLANSSAVEDTSGEEIDANGDGFKLRSTAAGINASGGTYIYLAMADIAGGGDLPWPLAR